MELETLPEFNFKFMITIVYSGLRLTENFEKYQIMISKCSNVKAGVKTSLVYIIFLFNKE